MSNYYDPDEQRQQGQPPQQPQGKLVLGGFQNSPKPAQRKPYQYQPPQPRQSNPAPQPQQGNQQYGYQGSNQPNQQNYAQYPQQGMQPNAVRTPYQPGQQARPTLQKPKQRKKRRGGCAIGCLSAILILFIAGFFASNVLQHVSAFSSVVSTQQPFFSTQTGYMNTSDRTNVLIMGYGGGSHDGAYLTDSMSVISLIPSSHHTSLVAVPRDLWIQYPPNSGQYTKVNSVYEIAAGYTNKDPKSGGDAAAQKVALVTGLDVKYWVTINFAGFRKLIDSIGGIDVYVPDSFNACYPANDDANVNAAWKIVQFNKGMQHMNGETAIEYARAREPLAVCSTRDSENLAELTDFGRSARQQIMVKAVLSKVKQSSTWPHLYDAMDALKGAIYTNMSLADLGEFAMKMDLNDPKTAHIGLSNQNVLVDNYDGGNYKLLPANGNWAVIPDYITKHLYN